MSEIKLLPCPFCGGEAEISINKSSQGQVGIVLCTKCSCKKTVLKHPNYDGDIQKDVTDSWNTRKPMERIIERLEVKKRRDGTESDREWGKYIGYVDSIKIVKEEGGIEWE